MVTGSNDIRPTESQGSATPRRAAMRRAAAVCLLATLLVALPPALSPADEYELITGLFTVTSMSQLDISGDVSNLLTLGQDGSGESAFDVTYVESDADATRLTINTNDVWDLSAKLAGTWSCPGAYDKDENDLFIRITNTPTGTIQNGADSYINLDVTDTEILNHDSAVSANVVDIQTKVLVDWTKDIPGAYSLTITYTLVTHVP